MSWQQVKLGDIFEIARGGSPRPIDQYITDDPNGLNWISIKDASNSSKYIYKTEKKIKPEGLHKTRLVHPDDFLLTNSMSFGRPYIMKTTGCIHDGWLVLSADKSKVDTDYFYHLLGSDFIYRKFVGLAAGAVVKNLNTDLVKSVTVPLPPINEQRRIASILDKADELRLKRQQAIEKLDQLLQATFIDMFGDPVSNPKGWEKETIGNLATFITSGSRGWAQYYTDSGSKFIRIQNLVKGDLDMSDCAYVNAPDSAEARRTLVQPGDVLLSITADLGRTAIVPDDIGLAHINQHIAILRLSGVNPAFASHYLASVGGKIQFEKLNRSAVKAGLNFDDIKSLEITLPPIELQDKYLKIVQAIKNYQKQLLQFKKQSDNLFQSLQNQVFSGNL